MGTLKLQMIQQYSDWYTGRWWMSCYIWYITQRGGVWAGCGRPCPVPSSLYQM